MPEHQQIEQSKKPEPTFQKQANHVSQSPVSNPFSIIQRARINPKSLSRADVMQLQRTTGNRAVGSLFSGMGRPSSIAQQVTVQRQEIPEEEEPLQGKMAETIQRQEPEEEELIQGKFETIQRQEVPEEEELIQGKFETVQRQEPEEEELLQGKMIETVQRQEIPEEEEPLQGKMIGTVQRQEIPEEEEPLQTKRENNIGMPDNLKAGVESLSGLDMSDVRVHYNSDKPAEVGALAYTQGTDIHVAPGQERHLPHEAWHVVQQVEGRVKPTGEVGGLPLNDSRTLESEADSMGQKALKRYAQVEKPKENTSPAVRRKSRAVANSFVQKKDNVKQDFGFVDNRQNKSVLNIIQRRRRNFNRIVLPILHRYWSDLYSRGAAKWKKEDSLIGEGEGACSAEVKCGNKRVEGKFDGSVHAEMNALSNVNVTCVEQIKISSAPCPRCAVVLEALGLSSLVSFRDSSSRMGPSWGWPGDLDKLMKLICPPSVTEEERTAYKNIIYSNFIAGAWNS